MTIKLATLTIIFQSTPSVGRETQGTDAQNPDVRISIHSLRGEGDSIANSSRSTARLFQSTPSVGRETLKVKIIEIKTSDFNPLPPWGGRLANTSNYYHNHQISIHSLRGEGDSKIVQWRKKVHLSRVQF